MGKTQNPSSNGAYSQTLGLKKHTRVTTPRLIIKTKTRIILCFLEPKKLICWQFYAKIKQTSFQLIERLSHFVLFRERSQCSFYIIAVLDSVAYMKPTQAANFPEVNSPKASTIQSLLRRTNSLAAAFLVDKDELCINHIHTKPDVVNSQNHSSFALCITFLTSPKKISFIVLITFRMMIVLSSLLLVLLIQLF